MQAALLWSKFKTTKRLYNSSHLKMHQVHSLVRLQDPQQNIKVQDDLKVSSQTLCTNEAAQVELWWWPQISCSLSRCLHLPTRPSSCPHTKTLRRLDQPLQLRIPSVAKSSQSSSRSILNSFKCTVHQTAFLTTNRPNIQKPILQPLISIPGSNRWLTSRCF